MMKKSPKPNSPLSNPRHEAFAQSIAEGKTQQQAYIDAGFKASRSAASRLSTNVNILARVGVLRTRVALRNEITIETILQELEKTRVLSIAMGQCHAAITATLWKAKLVGLIEK